MKQTSPTVNWVRKARITHIAVALLLTVSFLALHFFNYRLYWVSDWSQNQRNTLTQESVDLLGQIEGPLLIKPYFENRSELRAQIQRVVAKYQRWKPDIELQFIPTSLAREEVEQMGFSQLGQTVLQWQDQQQRVSSLDEKTISNALFNLISDETAWVIMLQGHGERDPYDDGVHGYGQLRQILEARGAKVQLLNLLSTPFIPDNTSLLVMAGSRQTLSQGELDLITLYLQNGGNLLLLADPDTDANLHALYTVLGLSPIDGVVIDGNTQLRNLLGIKHPAVLPVVEYPNHQINHKLRHQTLFPFAQGFTHSSASNWQYQPVLYSHERSWSETGNLLDEQLQYDLEQNDTKGPVMIGVALERELNGNSQRVVVIGDSDFAANGYLSQGDNSQFVLNLINWQNENEQLMAISPPRANDQLSELSDRMIIIIATLFLLIIPVGLVSIGVGLHWRQSRQ